MAYVQVPEINRKLARFFEISGVAPTATLAPEIVPIAVVADLTGPSEEDTGFQRYAYGIGSSAAGGAGTYSSVQLLNPTGSGVIVLLETIWCWADTATTVQLRHHDTALTTAATSKAWRDRRLSGSPACQIRTQTPGAAPGTTYAAARIAQNTMIEFPTDLILEEGQGIVVGESAANQGLSVNFLWYERGAKGGE